MSIYILKRFMMAIPTLIVASIIIFLLVHIAPGDPVRVMLGPIQDQALVEKMQQRLGLDLPLHEQYFMWLGNVLRGDFGMSISVQRGAPVANLIAERFTVTLELVVFAMVVALLIAIPTGIISALKQNKPIDHAARVFALVGISIPNFFKGILLILLFGVIFMKSWGAGGFVPLSDGLGPNLQRMLLPGLALGSSYSAIVMRMMRSSMLDVMSKDYVRTSRAMGIKRSDVVVRDIVKNALIPVVTVIGNSIGYLLGGSVVTESVFRLPGIGNLVLNAVFRRDFPVIQAVVLIIVLVRIVVNLGVDLTYAKLDPRIQYTSSE
ncbi:MAG: ABC transporter permease [Spirochaetia bacterium]|nr:ABC transporter permease [Spirochaetia bacterium]